jgi:hypothetical protein
MLPQQNRGHIWVVRSFMVKVICIGGDFGLPLSFPLGSVIFDRLERGPPTALRSRLSPRRGTAFSAGACLPRDDDHLLRGEKVDRVLPSRRGQETPRFAGRRDEGSLPTLRPPMACHPEPQVGRYTAK